MRRSQALAISTPSSVFIETEPRVGAKMAQAAVVSPRRRTRAAVLQTLYETDTARHDAGHALEGQMGFLDLEDSGRAFARGLVDGVLANREEIDKIIAEFASAWPVSQMAVVDRNILRIAVYEIMAGGDTPPRVAVNEAVELAKRFGSEAAPGFVNGVLGSVTTAREHQEV